MVYRRGSSSNEIEKSLSVSTPLRRVDGSTRERFDSMTDLDLVTGTGETARLPKSTSDLVREGSDLCWTRVDIERAMGTCGFCCS
jgi:hypothetical protein